VGARETGALTAGGFGVQARALPCLEMVSICILRPAAGCRWCVKHTHRQAAWLGKAAMASVTYTKPHYRLPCCCRVSLHTAVVRPHSQHGAAGLGRPAGPQHLRRHALLDGARGAGAGQVRRGRRACQAGPATGCPVMCRAGGRSGCSVRWFVAAAGFSSFTCAAVWV
jgi:hypothetical protein